MPAQNENSQNSVYILLGVFFMGIALVSLVSLVVIRTKAAGNTASTQITEIDNVAPYFGTPPTISDVAYDNKSLVGMPLVEGTTKSYFVNGYVLDNNGKSDIASVTVTLYDTDTNRNPAGANCTPDNSDSCYRTTLSAAEMDCPIEGDPRDCYFAAEFPLTFHTLPSDYVASATIKDLANASATDVSISTPVPSLLAINAENAINYGTTLNVGDYGSDMLSVSNWGNVISDLNVQTTSLKCTVGEIPEDLISFNGYALSNKIRIVSDYDLPKQVGATAGTAATDTLMILGPINNVQGACNGTLTLTARNN